MTNILYIVPPNLGYSGRLQQVKTLSEVCERKGIFVNIKVMSKNTVWSLLNVLADVYRYDYIFVAGSKKFASLLPLLKIFCSSQKFFYQSTSVGYDDPETIYKNYFLRYLFEFFNGHIAQLPVKVNTGRNAILVPNYVRVSDISIFGARGNRKDSKNCVLIGAVCERKGQLRFLHAIRKLESDDHKYSIIGPDSGFFESSPRYIEKFKEAVSSLQSVTFRGKLPHPKVVEELNRSNFIICASSQEGASNAYLEAIACGLTPVVLDDNTDTLLFDRFGFSYIYFEDFLLGKDLSVEEKESNFRLIIRLNYTCLKFYKGL